MPASTPIALVDEQLALVTFNADGLVPAIVQEAGTGQVLMMAWMNEASLKQTIETGRCTYWSRSRQQFWIKGETSGHIQNVKSIAVDCDQDTLLIEVEQVGAACHDHYRSCFYRTLQGGELVINSEKVE